jgi:glycopeptide antibiotics resistance protein
VKRHDSFNQVLWAIGLLTYAWWICSVAFFPLPLDSAAASSAGDVLRESVNLVPFRGAIADLGTLSGGQIVRQFGGNLLLFVPFTLFAPFVWPRLRTWWWPLAVGLAGSIAIELIQLGLSVLAASPYRRSDVDDVIVNTVGAFLGYALFLLGRWASGRWRTARAGSG